MEKESLKRSHKLILDDRNKLVLSGVKEVVSFDTQQVVLKTEYGLLTVKGEDLHVDRLVVEKGDVEVAGTINSLVYSNSKDFKEKGESLIAHLFK